MPDVRLRHPAQHIRAAARERVGDLRVEPVTGSPADDVGGRLRATEPIEDDRLGGHQREPCREGDVLAGTSERAPAAVPELGAVAERGRDPGAEVEPLRHAGPDLAHRPQDGPVALLAGSEHAGEVLDPVCSHPPPDEAEQLEGASDARTVGPFGPRHEPHLVAEEVRELVGRRRAAEVDQQRRVVDVPDRYLRQARAACQLRRQEAGPDRLLRRVAHTEVGGDREGGEQVGQPQLVFHRPPRRRPLTMARPMGDG